MWEGTSWNVWPDDDHPIASLHEALQRRLRESRIMVASPALLVEQRDLAPE